MVSRWRIFGDFLCPVLLASRVQHVSDLHLKFAVRPHHVWQYGRHPAEIRRGKNIEETTGQKYNGLPYDLGRSSKEQTA